MIIALAGLCAQIQESCGTPGCGQLCPTWSQNQSECGRNRCVTRRMSPTPTLEVPSTSVSPSSEPYCDLLRQRWKSHKVDLLDSSLSPRIRCNYTPVCANAASTDPSVGSQEDDQAETLANKAAPPFQTLANSPICRPIRVDKSILFNSTTA